MMRENKITQLKNLKLNKIREKVKEIKSELSEEEHSVITYSRNFTLSISNYCVNQCGYCYYNYKIPKLNSDDNVILLRNEQMDSLIQNALQYNCKEALILSGERPGSFQEVKEALNKTRGLTVHQIVNNIFLRTEMAQ